MTKKKIDYVKPQFQWTEDSTSDIKTGDAKKDIQLKDLVDDVNSTHIEKEVSSIAKNRRMQKKEMEKVVENLKTNIDDLDLNSDDGLEKLGVIESAVKSIDIDVFEKTDDSVAIIPQLATNIGEMSEGDVIEPEVRKAPKVGKKIEGENGNNWKSAIIPLLCISLLIVVILVAIQWSKSINSKQTVGELDESISVATFNTNSSDNVKKKNPDSIGMGSKKLEKENVVETKEGLLINNDLTVQNNNGQNKVNLGNVISVPGQNAVPVVQFVSTNEKILKVDDPLSINKIQPVNGANGLAPLSLAQWPNSINLKELSKNFAQVEALFPKNIYRKKDGFDGKDILTIYDKRSVVQEKFVKENQSCYFIPTELGQSWLGVNYFLLSYCFLDNQFIGVNMYANAESDMIKTLESNIKKVPYYHISSTYQGNGYTLVSIEQNNAYKILEDYRVLMLNKAVNR